MREYNVSHGILINGLPKAGTNLVKSVLQLIPGLFPRVKGPFFIDQNGMKTWIRNFQKFIRKSLNEKMGIYGVDWPREIPLSIFRKVLYSMRPNEFMQCHIPYSANVANLIKESGVILLVIIRDPRDIIISHYKYIMKTKSHFLHNYYSALSCDEERIYTSIVGLASVSKGKPMLLNIRERVLSMTEWGEIFPGHIIAFEDLVGPKGGGDEDVQRKELIKILSLLSLPDDSQLVDHLAKNLFGIGSTFRKGQISSWEDEFKDEHKLIFKKTAGDLLQQLGYEEDDGW